jgi:hypothetical protein
VNYLGARANFQGATFNPYPADVSVDPPVQIPAPTSATDPNLRNDVTWMVVLLQYLDRQDLYAPFRERYYPHAEEPKLNPTLPANVKPRPRVFLRFAFCPSDPPELAGTGQTPLSYVCNAGISYDSNDPTTAPAVYNGVFHDHSSMLAQSNHIKLSGDYLNQHDGTEYTLAYSENVQTLDDGWVPVDDLTTRNRVLPTRERVGMLWSRVPGDCAGTVPTNITRVNDCLNMPLATRTARPSSKHPGGVIVSFCGGRQIFMNDQIDWEVYAHLSTPDSNKSGVPGTFDPGGLGG